MYVTIRLPFFVAQQIAFVFRLPLYLPFINVHTYVRMCSRVYLCVSAMHISGHGHGHEHGHGYGHVGLGMTLAVGESCGHIEWSLYVGLSPVAGVVVVAAFIDQAITIWPLEIGILCSAVWSVCRTSPSVQSVCVSFDF